MKDIKGYEGLYAITSCGKVWSYYTKKFIKASKLWTGYLRVDLYKDGKATHFMLHRLVAETYIPNPANLPFINHKDEVKTHCWLSNLEWCTAEYNCNYGNHGKKIANAKYKKIRCVETNIVYPSLIAAEEATKILRSSISNCLCGKAKTAGGCHWEYCKNNL